MSRWGVGDDREAGETGAHVPRPEHRWPMAVAVLTAVFLQVGLPHRGRVPGWWVIPVLEIVLLATLVVQDPGRIDRLSKDLRRSTVALVAVMTAGTLLAAVFLVHDIFDGRTGVKAADLIGRGAAIWLTNIIVFSLWFWEFDRGGPARRAHHLTVPASFAFPENAMPELAAPGWTPQYTDYLYLSFTNATAFSPTDTLPLRTWAKMIMIIEAVLSLAIAVLVIARAINVLPG